MWCHQCFKFPRGESVVKVTADIKPFTETESYFADAKFYSDSDSVLEALLTKTHFTKSQKDEQVVELHAKEEAKVESKKKITDGHSLQKEKPNAKSSTPEVLRYILKSRRKKGTISMY